jgi:hypothetical protein
MKDCHRVSGSSAGTEAALGEVLALLCAADQQGTALEVCCVFCKLEQRSIERRFREFFSEFVNDPPARTAWRQARGLCREHVGLAAVLGDALGAAILYADLADQTCERWSAPKARGWGRPRIEPCLACVAASEASARYCAATAAALERAEVWSALENGPGLCIRHTEAICATARPQAAARLRALETARLRALQAELEEIIRKHDYRFRGEPWGAERDAWLRALHKLTRPD